MDCSVSNFRVNEWLLLSENISDCFRMPYSSNDMMSQLLHLYKTDSVLSKKVMWIFVAKWQTLKKS